jgi:uncharacterized protein (TIGR00369 family)
MSASPETATASGVIPLEQAREMTGLEIMRALRDGKFPPPPIAILFGSRLVEVDEGFAVFSGTPRYEHYNPLGSVHGGFAATMLDSCMGCAVHTRMKPGFGFTTLELKINYIRAMTTDTGPVRAEGRIIHVGGQTATAEGRIVDARDRLLAHGSTTCFIFKMPPAA